MFTDLPLPVLFLGSLIVVGLSVEAGFRVGKYRRQTSEQEKETPVGAIVAAMLGLLGFILAFTFSLAASRFEAKRQLVVEEANAIGTTYLRAGLIPEGSRVKVRALLAAYVQARLDVVQTGDTETLLRRSNELHRDLWEVAESVGTLFPESIVVGLFIQSLNETIDIHSTRVFVGLRSRLPGILWATLYLLTVLAMAGVGYFIGLTKSCRSLALIVLALAFAAMFALVADLDTSQQGLLRVGHQALIDLQNMMNGQR